MVEQRTRNTIGSIIHVILFLCEAWLVLGLLNILFSNYVHPQLGVLDILYDLWMLACSTTISVLVIMGLRLNVAQWTYRLCGAVGLLQVVVDFIVLLLQIWKDELMIKEGPSNMGIFIAVSLLLPMRSKTFKSFRPISITMVDASVHT